MFKSVLLGAILMICPNMNSTTASATNTVNVVTKEVVIKAKKKQAERLRRDSRKETSALSVTTNNTFMGFEIRGAKLGKVDAHLLDALADWDGPQATITSLFRPNSFGSKHFAGKAIDIKPDPSIMEWLISEEGTTWRENHAIVLYIEDNRNSEFLRKYKADPRTKGFVFLNRKASGKHFHLGLGG